MIVRLQAGMVLCKSAVDFFTKSCMKEDY
jgi:hypothetical protein